MGLGVTGANGALNGLTGTGHYINVCTGDPLTTGAHEASGGSNARQSITWPSASASAVAYSTLITVPVNAGTYTHWGIWSALTGGNFIAGGKLSKAAVLAAAGNVNITSVTLLTAGV